MIKKCSIDRLGWFSRTGCSYVWLLGRQWKEQDICILVDRFLNSERGGWLIVRLKPIKY